MTTATAIITDGKGNFVLDQLLLGDPQKGEIVMEIKASGVCHTDFDSMSWGRPFVMGHEGSGIVLACGPGVHHVQASDRVLLKMAEWMGEASPYAMQHLLDRASWDADAARDRVREYVVRRWAARMRC